MARRGNELREHILAEAKNVFLELGFDRTSMDLVAQRAQTSKRSLYAHFETKDVLFVAVIGRIQELFDGRMKTPERYADDPTEAAVLFCGRFAQMLTWAPILRTCRLGIAEAERLPEASSGLYEAFFGRAHARLCAFLEERFALDGATMTLLADQALTSAVQPWFTRALFGLEELRDEVPDQTTITTDVELAPLRASIEIFIQNHVGA
ncbi:TetR/AcrR family transcriptional regulator [Curtobacterium sp. TC1]|uniref:TetR/AcrR family transcriptional regulator n=1 Tax=Curtobacterium sp. TC1 TaxID=2862880 RepID=UPI001C9A616B|nr:TetR/AcrR family transcriptional regulator [Curtobacterium sp. TC1]QZQ53838.1 TetR/AcrR family transcriptional regulator [Curtobacterium sp. TC1]